MTEITDFREERAQVAGTEEPMSDTDHLDEEALGAFLHRILSALVRDHGELRVLQSSISAPPLELVLTPSSTEDNEVYVIKENNEVTES